MTNKDRLEHPENFNPTQKYVLYSDTHGIYLGNGWFSLKQADIDRVGDKPGVAPALTKINWQSYDTVRQAKDAFPNCRYIEVHPSQKDKYGRGMATPEDCADALLPIW